MAKRNLEIENAEIMYRNFAGVKDLYNAEGNRNFHVIIDDEDLAAELREEGWNIKIRQPREEGDLPTYHVKVNVQMNSKFPPKVFLVTKNVNFLGETEYNKTLLDEETIGMLDAAEFESIDLTIEPYEWAPGKMSGYLKNGYFLIKQDRFASKYE